MTRPSKPNAEEKRRLRAAEVRLFVQATGRKADKNGSDPNDRQVDRRVTDAVRRVKPEEFDRLLRDGEEEA